MAAEAKLAPTVDDGPPPIAQRKHGDTLVLFDVDGTLTIPAQKADDSMMELLTRLRKDYVVGIVGAAHFEKQQEQLLGNLHSKFDFVFAESGVDAFRDGEQIHAKSMAEQLGPELWASFQTGLDGILLAEVEERERLLKIICPGSSLSERGTFLEKRKCTVNVTPVGRTPGLSKEERAAYDKADTESGLRVRVKEAIFKQFGPDTEYDLVANIGGQIGLDVQPRGWDKTFCLQFIEQFPTVHFFGDKTSPGGGDYELYEHARTVGHAVKSPEDTMEQIKTLFMSS